MPLPPWKFPYTNTRDINLDWIIKTVKNLYNTVFDKLSEFDSYNVVYIESTPTGTTPLVFQDSRIFANMIPINCGWLYGGPDYDNMPDFMEQDPVDLTIWNFSISAGQVVCTPRVNQPLKENTQAYIILGPEVETQLEPLSP